MPRGFKAVKEAIAEIDAKREAAQSDAPKRDFVPALWWKLPNSGDSCIFRALEDNDEVAFAAIHNVDVPDKKRFPYGLDIICRDQNNDDEPCPGCEMGIKRSFKGWLNIIWRDAPDFPQDENGKWNTKVDYSSVPTTSDKVAILSSGPVLFDRLEELNDEYDGLKDLDLQITRSGTGTSTRYKIVPVKTGGKVKKSKLSEADLKLAEAKNDLNFYLRIPDYEEWQQRAQGIFSGSSDGPEPTILPKSPLGKKETIFG